MHRLVNKLIVALACLSAVLAPVFANSVLCVGGNGHMAVERAHETTGCPELAGVLPPQSSDGAPCNDVPVPSDELVVQNSRLSQSEADWVLVPPLLDAALATIFIAQADLPVHPPSIEDSPLATSPAVAQGLRTTVLLI